MNATNLSGGLRPALQLLKALSSEPRLLILCELGGGERSVGQLTAVAGLSQSALSQHLAKLRAEGILRTRRQSQTIFYSLASPQVAAVIRVLAELYCPTAQPAPPGAQSGDTT